MNKKEEKTGRKKDEREKNFNKVFGQRLKEIIKKDRKLTLKEISGKADVSPTVISSYYNGEIGLTAYRLSLIINSLNLSDPEIIGLFRFTDVNRVSEPAKPRLVEKPLPFPDAESKESCEILTEAVKYKDSEPLINKTYEHILLLLKDLKKDITAVKKSGRRKKTAGGVD